MRPQNKRYENVQRKNISQTTNKQRMNAGKKGKEHQFISYSSFFFGKPRLKSNNPKAAKVEQTIFWTHLVEGEIVILKNTRYLYLLNKKK